MIGDNWILNLDANFLVLILNFLKNTLWFCHLAKNFSFCTYQSYIFAVAIL